MSQIARTRVKQYEERREFVKSFGEDKDVCFLCNDCDERSEMVIDNETGIAICQKCNGEQNWKDDRKILIQSGLFDYRVDGQPFAEDCRDDRLVYLNNGKWSLKKKRRVKT